MRYGWLWKIPAALIALVILVPLCGYFWLRTGLPVAEGRLSLDGLNAPVEVLWDGNGVPSLFAESMADAYFALGFVHSRERLWQMETQRRIGQGRFAEIVGAQAVRFDRFLRTLGVYRLAEEEYAKAAPELRQALDSYTAGVNAYLARRREPLPLEFQLFWLDPEPWRPADSLVWAKLMALQLVGNMRGEMLRAGLLQKLKPEQVDDLFPVPGAQDPVTLADIVSPDWKNLAAAIPSLGPATASNEWVLAGRHTETGKPILVNDPHLALNAPILWYLARIVTPELTLTGATVPGVPFHLLGQNGHIAWGFTTTGTDVQDLYVEKLEPGNGDRYLTPAGPVPFFQRDELIRVRFGEDLRLSVRATRHGPIISDIDEDARKAAGEGQAISIAFTGLVPDDTTALSLYRLNRARSWDEFREALRLYRTPQQNMVYADVAGNIGFLAPGLVPIRSRGDGRYPVPGWKDEYRWTGFIPFDELPQSLNPPAGQIVNANNAIVSSAYPYHLTRDWEEPYRAERIQQLLAEQPGPYTVKDGERMLMDSVSLAARDLLPLMLVAESASSASRRALELLRAWDGFAGRNRPEPLIFTAWLQALGPALYADELGLLAKDYGGLQPRVVRQMLMEANAWCDNVTTPARESCAEILSASLDTAIEGLSQRYGPDIALWRWGAAHFAPFPHTPLGFIPVLRDLIDIGMETDGDGYTVNRGAHYGGGAMPFAHRHGAGYRAVYDLANLANSRFMIATGQSGNPLSPRYGDFVRRWRDGEHFTIAGSRQEVGAKASARLNLQPERMP